MKKISNDLLFNFEYKPLITTITDEENISQYNLPEKVEYIPPLITFRIVVCIKENLLFLAYDLLL